MALIEGMAHPRTPRRACFSMTHLIDRFIDWALERVAQGMFRRDRALAESRKTAQPTPPPEQPPPPHHDCIHKSRIGSAVVTVIPHPTQTQIQEAKAWMEQAATHPRWGLV